MYDEESLGGQDHRDYQTSTHPYVWVQAEVAHWACMHTRDWVLDATWCMASGWRSRHGHLPLCVRRCQVLGTPKTAGVM